MKLDSLSRHFPPEVLNVFEEEGIKALHPPQEMALKAGLLEGRSMVVAAPTASGKTLIAELAILNTILKNKKKAVYIVPLKALASEKYKEFKNKYSKFGIKIARSVGNLDSNDPWLADYDLIIATSEKLDSLIRHGMSWANKIGLLVVDEIHLLNDMSRGPTLEITITRLREMTDFQILGLSATIKNAEELAGWLDAELVKSDFRPVELKQGVYLSNSIYFKDSSAEIPNRSESIDDLVRHVLENNKQMLIFVSSRRNAESQAEKLKAVTSQFTKKDEPILEKKAESILNALEMPTEQCRKAAGQVKHGVSFHHAGLVNRQREIIEEAFRKNRIKAIVATPTLAAGVNLPAYMVLVRDMKRFEGGAGMRYLPVLEVQQMMGRAGRPRYDKEGIGLLSAKSEKEKENIFNNYIHGDTENITSKLSVEPVLRMHILSLIATGHINSKEQLENFMKKTFYAHQYKNLDELKRKTEKMLRLLNEYELVEMDEDGSNDFVSAASIAGNNAGTVKATELGKRVAELYIDPETAHSFIEGLRKANSKTDGISFMQLVSYCREMRPPVRPLKAMKDELEEKAEKAKENLLSEEVDMWDWDYNLYAGSIYTALMFRSWTRENSEDHLMKNFNTAPGELRVKLENADWLLYSLQEIGKITGMNDYWNELQKLRLRIKHGVKEELLKLVQIRGIGRVRARRLYMNNIKTGADIKNTSLQKLESIVGKKTAEKLKNSI